MQPAPERSRSFVKQLEIDTQFSAAKAHLLSADEPRAALVLGHGASGGVTAPDLVAVAGVAHSGGLSVVQGSRDRFGIPPSTERRTVVQVAADHSLRTDLGAIEQAVGAWLVGLGKSADLQHGGAL
jgi:hypothetical protein